MLYTLPKNYKARLAAFLKASRSNNWGMAGTFYAPSVTGKAGFSSPGDGYGEIRLMSVTDADSVPFICWTNIHDRHPLEAAADDACLTSAGLRLLRERLTPEQCEQEVRQDQLPTTTESCPQNLELWFERLLQSGYDYHAGSPRLPVYAAPEEDEADESADGVYEEAVLLDEFYGVTLQDPLTGEKEAARVRTYELPFKVRDTRYFFRYALDDRGRVPRGEDGKPLYIWAAQSEKRKLETAYERLLGELEASVELKAGKAGVATLDF